MSYVWVTFVNLHMKITWADTGREARFEGMGRYREGGGGGGGNFGDMGRYMEGGGGGGATLETWVDTGSGPL